MFTYHINNRQTGNWERVTRTEALQALKDRNNQYVYIDNNNPLFINPTTVNTILKKSNRKKFFRFN